MLFYCLNHGKCLGFQILKEAESPKHVFDFLFSRLEKAPTTVVYDNACNLSEYCMAREPG